MNMDYMEAIVHNLVVALSEECQKGELENILHYAGIEPRHYKRFDIQWAPFVDMSDEELKDLKDHWYEREAPGDLEGLLLELKSRNPYPYGRDFDLD